MVLIRNFIILLFVFSVLGLKSQDRVSFRTSDDIDVVAHLYEMDTSYPYIILLHQEGYSKGEYKEIAISLLKLKYNCLAVDLRYGGTLNSVPNETSQNAEKARVPRSMYDAQIDIEAAVEYAYNKSNQKVVLFGSSYSGTLAIKLGVNNPKVKAVIAYSPGEFFRNKFLIHDVLEKADIPIYIAGTQLEYNYLLKLSELTPKGKLVVFQPQNNVGQHGAKALWKTNNEVSQEYWLSLLMFINNIK